ncbi:hypothetical protein KSS87_008698, partial [Heliosperma pusillum]
MSSDVMTVTHITDNPTQIIGRFVDTLCCSFLSCVLSPSCFHLQCRHHCIKISVPGLSFDVSPPNFDVPNNYFCVSMFRYIEIVARYIKY